METGALLEAVLTLLGGGLYLSLVVFKDVKYQRVVTRGNDLLVSQYWRHICTGRNDLYFLFFHAIRVWTDVGAIFSLFLVCQLDVMRK